MTDFFDTVEQAIAHVSATDASVPDFVDAIRGVNLSDNNSTLAFLAPQVLRVEQAIQMVRYPAANYAEYIPVDTTGNVWSAGSLFFSGDQFGEARPFSAGSDDMPYADFGRTQHIQENSNYALGYKWTRKELETAQVLGVNILAQKAGSAMFGAERKIHRIAMLGDGELFATGFLNNAQATVVATPLGTIAAATPDQSVQIINAALAQVEADTLETYLATDLALPTAVYNGLNTRRMTDTNMTVLNYIRENAVVPNLSIRKTRHLTNTLVAYANTPDVHRFHLPGGGHELGAPWQKGPYSWEVPGVFGTGGYELRVPKAVVRMTGIA